MPKLDATHILERLIKRVKELEEGEDIAAKEIRSLLTKEQQQELEKAWTAQEKLRTQQRARTEEEKKELDWKSKREVRIEVFKNAIKTSWENIEADFQKIKFKVGVRQARIYFDALNEAEKAGKDKQTAKNWANNELTRAGLKRLDGQIVGYRTARDKEVSEMEEALRESLKNQMTAEELEQLELSKKHDKKVTSRIGKARKQ